VESIDLESTITLLAQALFVTTFLTMGVLSAKYMGTGRPKAFRAAARKTANLVAQWGVWLTFLIVLAYAVLVHVDRLGLVVVLIFVLALLGIFALGLLAGWIHSRRHPGEVV